MLKEGKYRKNDVGSSRYVISSGHTNYHSTRRKDQMLPRALQIGVANRLFISFKKLGRKMLNVKLPPSGKYRKLDV